MVLVDDDGVRANMTAHWLAQLGWRNVHVLDNALPSGESGTVPASLPPVPHSPARDVGTGELRKLIDGGAVMLVDIATSKVFTAGHVPRARFALRRDLPDIAARTSGTLAILSPDGALARYAAAEVADGRDGETLVLEGGTAAWREAGLPTESGLSDAQALSPPNDLYKRPYEGTDNPAEAMQAYLDWEFGLVAQLERDGTHGFKVLDA